MPVIQGKKLIADIDSARPRTGQCALWWLGQQSFVIKLGDRILYLDPFLSSHNKRLIPPLLKPEELTHASLVFGSHDHTDHIDRTAWPLIARASPRALFIIPEYFLKALPRELDIPASRFIGLNDGRTARVKGIKITGIAAAHELLSPDSETGLHPYLGYVIEYNGFTLYHAGDTCNYEGFQTCLKKWRFDLMMLPINGRDARRLKANCIGNMTYQEAADLAGALEPGLTIPSHYDMFAMNSEDPELFIDYMEVKYPKLTTRVAKHGERIVINLAPQIPRRGT
jgi:L-ascorbate metabolism protein UlaG (beta-lactamase superfamily)